MLYQNPSQQLLNYNKCLCLWKIISITVYIYSPSSDWLAVALTAVLGLSNGVFGSLPIILAPGRVSQKKEGTELTGNLMTGCYL